MKFKFNNRPIEYTLEGIDTRDYPDFVDAYVSEANYSDNGNSLTEDELDTLNDDSQLIHEMVYDKLY